MRKKWIAMIVVAAVIAGVLIGVLLPRGEENISSATTEQQTPMPTAQQTLVPQTSTQQPMPTPTPPATTTPTQSGKIILESYADARPKNVIETTELISSALAGKYQEGTKIAFSGTFEDSCSGERSFYLYFGPQYKGFYVGVLFHTDYLRLKKGDGVIIGGVYAGFKKIGESVGKNINIILIDDTRLFLITR